MSNPELVCRTKRGVEMSELNDLLSVIEPQPRGIKYMLGGESWMDEKDQSPIRLNCEEWGNLGPMELNPEIEPNKAGLRVKCTETIAPENARGFTVVDGIYYWTRSSVWDK